MHNISNLSDVLDDGETTVFIPFSTNRRGSIPDIPQSLAPYIPKARLTFEKIQKGSSAPRDSYLYVSGGNNYLFYRVKTSSRAQLVDTDMLNKGIDILEEEFPDTRNIVVLGTGVKEIDQYIKLLFKANSSAYFLEGEL
jgi:hypothetical protein